MSVVLDTNVLVSALLTPYGPAARVLDAVLAGRLVLLFDDRILCEYEEVLGRGRFGFDPQDVKALLDFFRSEGVAVVAPPLKAELPDPDDLMFVEVALAGKANAIVTGNKKHFPAEGCGGILVVSPAELLSML
ncbi:MAG TPA: putative toxin-antitoxin system toxin component, PIN family [Peptococcaceae bacterium]|nr:MAG: Nucleic acid binding protein [Moorella sp. 60_41]HBT47305.1 putative toxin-antitoxin system toxin component, PIN family [Peptococcaceae bacterium]